MAYTFVISDESVNNIGFWALTAGIDINQFSKNPIMYWMHARPEGEHINEILPIGYWDNIRIENNQLLADAVFDENDDFALRIKSKVDAKVIRMASAGLEPKYWSEAPEDIKPGQTIATLIKSVLKEASIVDRGANNNALRLYNSDGSIINLSDSMKNILPKLNSKQMKLNENSLNLLGLKDTDTDQAMNEAIQKLAEKANNAKKELDAEIQLRSDAQKELKKLKEANAIAEKAAFLSKLDKKELKLTAEQKAFYIELFENSGATIANKAVNILPVYSDLNQIPGGGNKPQTKELKEKWDQAHADGTLNKLKDENPNLFEEMKKAKFNK